jgi:GT2 family glycosyltransferase
MNMLRTCVITINYHGAADTAACIKSLLASSVPLAIVVVDNTPNDPGLESALSFCPDVKLIYAPDNIGFSRGNNLGICWALEHTECEYIFFLNNDATVESDTIEKLENVLKNQPNIGISAPRIVFMSDSSMLWYGGGEVSWVRGSAKTPGFMGNSEAPLALKSRYVSFASGCSILVRRELLEKEGGFDERFFMYEEDLELCLRARENGYLIWYESSALVHHVSHGAVTDSSRENANEYVSMLNSSNPKLPFYVYNQVRNRFLNMRLHAKGYKWIFFVAGFSLFLLKKIIQFLIAKRWDGIFAIFSGWRSYLDVYKL